MITKHWILICLMLIGIISCNQPEQKSVFVPNPTTLKELFSGFNEAEISPEFINSKKEPVVIVATGHLYPLLKFPDVYNSLIEKINEQKPDYFFTLGDIVRNNTDEEWDTVHKNLSKIDAKVFFAPGNHDLNYHYERYVGKRDHQIEAEMRYLKQVGYRYKLIQDQFANYVFINANDSAKRIISFIDEIKESIDTTKQLLLISSQSLWVNKQQDPNDPHTWVNRPFHRDELLPFVEDFDYLIHGDWGGKFYRGTWKKSNGFFDVMGVGNRKVGDPVFITRLEIYQDSISAKPIWIDIAENNEWFNQ